MLTFGVEGLGGEDGEGGGAEEEDDGEEEGDGGHWNGGGNDGGERRPRRGRGRKGSSHGVPWSGVLLFLVSCIE